MWELIEANKRRSMLLFFCMGACLMLLGYLIGMVISPDRGGVAGIIAALSIWIIWSLISYFSGDSIVLKMSRAQRVSRDLYPQLFNIVEEMKIAAGLIAMPRIFIIPHAAPNAFTTGTKPANCAIVVTTGLLSMMSRDELQGVVAHEMSHILNRDVQYMTFAGILLGSIVVISDLFLRSFRYSGGLIRYRSGRSSKGGKGLQGIVFILTLIFSILAPVLARLFYFAVSRKREYLADASAVRLTRYPEGLASALEKLSGTNMRLAYANQITAPMFIVNPLNRGGLKLSDVTSTHPPTSERIRILRGMLHGVNYADYQKAYFLVGRDKKPIIPASELLTSKEVVFRDDAEAVQAQVSGKQQQRDLGDLMMAVNNFTFLLCVCGLKIKMPPDRKKQDVVCPRCGRQVKLPAAELAAVAAVAGITKEEASKEDIGQVYQKRGRGWESFSCSCGNLIQISPAFIANHITCGACGKKTEIIFNIDH